MCILATLQKIDVTDLTMPFRFCPCHGSHYDICKLNSTTCLTSELIRSITAGRIRKGPAPVSMKGAREPLQQYADVLFSSSTWKCHSTTSTTRRASLSLDDRAPHRIYKLPITCYSLSFDATRKVPRGSMDVMVPPVSF